MISSKHSFLITVTITVALLSATTTTAKLLCAKKLAQLKQCAKKPSTSCCKALKAVTKHLSCLCQLYENPTVLPNLGNNVNKALGPLLESCKIRGDVTACKAAKDTSGVSRVAWTGMSSLLVLFASFVLA
ncbi:uncharacterized protein LOC132638134 [Lycium barbarum]|uniref:uncharacterized protein LOC132638134 n=1 Tax=Lycium barbarum TaxID=112863 RepID=UPI00293EBAA1|nr:uncharacterized protein LOC132638134 [Lycium barbarum]